MPEDDAEPAVQTAPQEAPSDELLHDTDEEYLPKDQTSQKRKREGDEQLTESNRIRRRRQAPKEQVTKAIEQKVETNEREGQQKSSNKRKAEKTKSSKGHAPKPRKKKAKLQGREGNGDTIGAPVDDAMVSFGEAHVVLILTTYLQNYWESIKEKELVLREGNPEAQELLKRVSMLMHRS